MRLLVVSQYCWLEDFRINEVARTLAEKGVEVEVLTGKPNYPGGRIFPGYRAWGCQREVYGGIVINRIPLLARGNGGWRLALNYLSFVVCGMLCAPWLLRGKRFDVIFVYAPSPILQAIPALLLGRLKRCPVVLWVQDLWPGSLAATGYVNSRAILWLVERLVRFIYRHADLLLVQSEAFAVPVAAADIPAMRELGGDAAMYFDPRSEADMARSMESMLINTALCGELRNAGPRRAGLFDWDSFTEKLVHLYQGLPA